MFYGKFPFEVDWSVVTPVMSPPVSHRLAVPAHQGRAKMRSGDGPSIDAHIFSFSVNTDAYSKSEFRAWPCRLWSGLQLCLRIITSIIIAQLMFSPLIFNDFAAKIG